MSKKQMQALKLLGLPSEVLTYLLTWLPAADLASVSLVCHHLRSLAEEEVYQGLVFLFSFLDFFTHEPHNPFMNRHHGEGCGTATGANIANVQIS